MKARQLSSKLHQLLSIIIDSELFREIGISLSIIVVMILGFPKFLSHFLLGLILLSTLLRIIRLFKEKF